MAIMIRDGKFADGEKCPKCGGPIDQYDSCPSCLAKEGLQVTGVKDGEVQFGPITNPILGRSPAEMVNSGELLSKSADHLFPDWSKADDAASLQRRRRLQDEKHGQLHQKEK